MIRNNLNLLLDGERCEGNMYGLYMIGGNSHVDNHTSVDHLKPHSQSNEMYKGVLDGKSTGVFNGKIYVRPHAQKTNAFQSNRNILLSDQATMDTKPQLEIWADDVKCSHGATVGSLDIEPLFYLKSRGIPEKKAKALLTFAFAMDLIEKIKLDSLQKLIESKIMAQLGYEK
jgi:Fe-S cluster assembly protein SufD